MPIVRIEAIVDDPGVVAPLLSEVVAVAADALGAAPGHCWARLVRIEPGAFMEGGRLRSAQADHSPLVTVTAYEGRSAEAKARCLEAVAVAVAERLGVPWDDVFAEFQEIRRGHVLTGGQIR